VRFAVARVGDHQPAFAGPRDVARGELVVRVGAARQQLGFAEPGALRRVEGLVGLLKSSLPANLEVVSAVEDERIFAFIDPLGLENALLNLSFNARDAMPNGGRLSIAAQRKAVDGALASELDLSPGDYVTVAVVDTGSGLCEFVLDAELPDEPMPQLGAFTCRRSPT